MLIAQVRLIYDEYGPAREVQTVFETTPNTTSFTKPYDVACDRYVGMARATVRYRTLHHKGILKRGDVDEGEQEIHNVLGYTNRVGYGFNVANRRDLARYRSEQVLFLNRIEVWPVRDRFKCAFGDRKVVEICFFEQKEAAVEIVTRARDLALDEGDMESYQIYQNWCYALDSRLPDYYANAQHMFYYYGDDFF